VCAVYEVDVSNPEIDQVVTFDASLSHSSSDITDYEWLFGDGNTTSVEDDTITHAYTANATYTVVLTVTSAVGTAALTQYITVGWGANLTIGSSYIGVSFTFDIANAGINETIYFNASASISSSDITEYEWNFGDENMTTGEYETISHAYSTNGTYDVSLKVTSLAGYAEMSIPYAVSVDASSGLDIVGGFWLYAILTTLIAFPSLIAVIVIVRKPRGRIKW